MPYYKDIALAPDTTMNPLQTWEDATQDLAGYFVQKYFGKDATDVWWIGGYVGGTLTANDYFFTLQDMVEFLREKYSKKDMFSYYDYALKLAMKDMSPLTISVWRKVHKGRLNV